MNWLDNKIYITDRTARSIVEYDIVTEMTRDVLSDTGPGSDPKGISVYPYPDYGYVEPNELQPAHFYKSWQI